MQHPLTITDNRTWKKYQIPILDRTYKSYGAAIRAADLRQIKTSDDDFRMLSYDPGYGNQRITEKLKVQGIDCSENRVQ